MKRDERPAWSLGRVVIALLALAAVGAGLGTLAGCKPAVQPTSPPTDLSVTPPSEAGQTSAQSKHSEGKTGAKEPGGLTARQVLEAMVAAYKKASSYDDKGYVEAQYRIGPAVGKPEAPARWDFSVAMARPNKLRVHAYAAMAIADGEKLWEVMVDTPNQVFQRDAPPQLSVESLFPNPEIADAMARGPTQGFSWLPLQLILLLSADPLKTLLHQSQEPVLLEPARLGPGEWDCYRVQIQREDGTGVFWIDQKTHVLRRFEFPTGLLRMMIAQGERVSPSQIEELSLVAEFQEARFDAEIDPRTFQFQSPAGASLVDDFMPEDLRWLGRKVPDFSFVDLEGKPVTPASFAGKIAVLDFWATWCQPCRATLPDLEQVYQKYKDDGKVAFLAVSGDESSVPDQRLRDMFAEIAVTVPIARDPQQFAFRAFEIRGFPTSLVVDAQGVVQHRQTGGSPPGLGASQLTARLAKLLEGKNLAQETLQQYQQVRQGQLRQFGQMLQNCVKQDLYVFMPMQPPAVEPAKRAEPRTLKLTQLWSSTELSAPGNILVLDRPAETPRILVVEEGKSIAELDAQGKVAGLKPLKLPTQEPAFFLRTAAGSDGKRYFAGSSIGVQQVHLWDDQFNLLMSFPKTAPESPHQGIADVRMADFRGDGTLSLAISYLGVVGVQGVSLEGTRVWANKSAVQSLRLGVLGPNADGQRGLLCMNNPGDSLGSLVILDPNGQKTSEFSLPDRAVVWIEADDLDGDGQAELCALTQIADGTVEAVGFTLKGETLWSYALPPGAHQFQIEAVTAGKLLPNQPGQWLLAAADGTLHFLDAAGKLIDVFAYGQALTGVAVAQWEGKHVLLVATAESVDAWQVEPAGS